MVVFSFLILVSCTGTGVALLVSMTNTIALTVEVLTHAAKYVATWNGQRGTPKQIAKLMRNPQGVYNMATSRGWTPGCDIKAAQEAFSASRRPL